MSKSLHKPTAPKRGKKKVGSKMVQTTVKAPIAKSSIIRNSEPSYKQGRPGCVLVEKTEYIGEVVSSSTSGATFAVVSSYPINIGSVTTFPWASGMSGLYESYVFKRLSFHFRTESPTTTQGFVGLVIDYNPIDPQPATKVAAMDYEESVRGPVWQNFDHVCGQKNLNKRKSYFSRGSLTDASIDPLLYDVGTLYVIAGGVVDASQSLGELWVSYSVEFITPELERISVSLDGELIMNDVVVGLVENQGLIRTVALEMDVGSQSYVDANTFDQSFELSGNRYSTRGLTIFDSLPLAPQGSAFFLTNSAEGSYSTPPTVPRSYWILQPNRTYVAEIVLKWLSGFSNFSVDPTITFQGDSDSVVTQLSYLLTDTGAILSCEITTGPIIGYLGALLSSLGTIAAASAVKWTTDWFFRERSPNTEGGGLVPTLVTAFELKKRQRIRESLRQPLSWKKCLVPAFPQAHPSKEVGVLPSCTDTVLTVPVGEPRILGDTVSSSALKDSLCICCRTATRGDRSFTCPVCTDLINMRSFT